jgi:gamma-F420-2:alpha-L-glutamate ligase
MSKIWILSKIETFEYENARLMEALTSRGIDSEIVEPSNFDIIVTKDIREGLRYLGQPVELPQLLLVRYGAGITKFMLALIRQLEKAGVICINCAGAIETVKDKLHTSQILSSHGISIPTTMVVRFPVEEDVVGKEIGFPCVVKIVTGSYGVGVYLCEKKKDFAKLMEFIEIFKSSKTLIVQEFLGDRPGEDLRVLVVGGKVIGAMKRTAPEGDFRANISNGGSGELYPLTDEIEYIARETAKVLNLDIAGIDLLFDNRGFRVCEANSNPGFKGFEEYCSIDVAEVIADYIKFKLS